MDKFLYDYQQLFYFLFFAVLFVHSMSNLIIYSDGDILDDKSRIEVSILLIFSANFKKSENDSPFTSLVRLVNKITCFFLPVYTILVFLLFVYSFPLKHKFERRKTMTYQIMTYSGMTVNERLVVSGLIKEFDEAKHQRDKEKLIQLLKKVDVDDKSIQQILESLGIVSE